MAVRRSHRVSAQISPSAWTSAPRLEILPKSPYVNPPVPALPPPGQTAAGAPTVQSSGCRRMVLAPAVEYSKMTSSPG
jgi:hypothetical protein